MPSSFVNISLEHIFFFAHDLCPSWGHSLDLIHLTRDEADTLSTLINFPKKISRCMRYKSYLSDFQYASFEYLQGVKHGDSLLFMPYIKDHDAYIENSTQIMAQIIHNSEKSKNSTYDKWLPDSSALEHMKNVVVEGKISNEWVETLHACCIASPQRVVQAGFLPLIADQIAKISTNENFYISIGSILGAIVPILAADMIWNQDDEVVLTSLIDLAVIAFTKDNKSATPLTKNQIEIDEFLRVAGAKRNVAPRIAEKLRRQHLIESGHKIVADVLHVKVNDITKEYHKHKEHEDLHITFDVVNFDKTETEKGHHHKFKSPKSKFSASEEPVEWHFEKHEYVELGPTEFLAIQVFDDTKSGFLGLGKEHVFKGSIVLPPLFLYCLQQGENMTDISVTMPLSEQQYPSWTIYSPKGFMTVKIRLKVALE